MHMSQSLKKQDVKKFQMYSSSNKILRFIIINFKLKVLGDLI
jgi:hypothetical protein